MESQFKTKTGVSWGPSGQYKGKHHLRFYSTDRDLLVSDTCCQCDELSWLPLPVFESSSGEAT